MYKNSPTLAAKLINYKNLAQNVLDGSTKDRKTWSLPCGKCALCGNHGNHSNMVPTIYTIKSNTGREFKLLQNLNCKNYGIYAAQCKLCKEHYVGQTINTFSKRWTAHHSIWNKFEIAKNNDKAALLTHFSKFHQNFLNSKPNIANCFDVIFLEQPKNTITLDWLEDKWYNKLNATININKLLLPKFK